MRLDLSQQMKMDQRMVLAPRMIQSMEILQLPLMALQERIEQELLSNPVLEQDESTPTTVEAPTPAASASDNADPAGAERTMQIQEGPDNTQEFARLDSVADDYDGYYSRTTYTAARRGSDEPDRKMEAMANTAAAEQSLTEHLHEQWRFVETPEIIKKAGTVIIDFIEDSGYLTVELSSLEEYVREPVTAEQMAEALRLVQTLEPTGVGARNLQECLLLQLAATDGNHGLEVELISHHLKDLEMNRFPAIVKKTGRSLEEIQQALKSFGRLDPRPGMQFGRQETQYVLPDVIVEYNEDEDTYLATLSDGSLPGLRINEDYSAMAKQKGIDAKARQYLSNRVRSAQWLIESIEQRKTTLLRVVSYVLRTQRAFLDHGQLHLKPLPMVEVAEKLGIHVGTVSRAVSGKYVQTPTGIFPLRSFFSGGKETSDGESVSWDAIKAKLQEIVDAEDKSKPFNDDALVQELAKHGITVARRTVAKYRGLMNIPPARRRKRFD